LDTPSYMMA